LVGSTLTVDRGVPRAELLAVWVAVAVAFGALLAAAAASESGLDDPDPAQQRPGIPRRR